MLCLLPHCYLRRQQSGKRHNTNVNPAGPNDCSLALDRLSYQTNNSMATSESSALGRLSPQANNSMAMSESAVSNPGPPHYSLDDINVMHFHHSALCADSRVVKGITFMSSLYSYHQCAIPNGYS